MKTKRILGYPVVLFGYPVVLVENMKTPKMKIEDIKVIELWRYVECRLIRKSEQGGNHGTGTQVISV